MQTVYQEKTAFAEKPKKLAIIATADRIRFEE